ncbi:N-acetylmuramoyl-L-alanine amidase [Streptomyces longwoodensis]|uniref:peptidoglycan recognition protein family protein n=1 Tax=Streptomyces longwoodensis TaxID=68231 RepID=UPI0036FA6C97
MTATIAYDLPVTDLIEQLNATGHVYHNAYQKTSVTLHHNAARFSHQGLLENWKTRPASAHFDVDAAGAVAQYVKVNEYAWAVGNMTGNQRSISIEMANATLGPGWTVADVTWKGAARLAGWLFAKAIGERPSKNNLFYHHHWSATVCAGPYMEGIYDKVLAAVQEAYDQFKDAPPAILPRTRPRPR